jgi:hypothetical protein
MPSPWECQHKSGRLHGQARDRDDKAGRRKRETGGKERDESLRGHAGVPVKQAVMRRDLREPVLEGRRRLGLRRVIQLQPIGARRNSLEPFGAYEVAGGDGVRLPDGPDPGQSSLDKHALGLRHSDEAAVALCQQHDRLELRLAGQVVVCRAGCGKTVDRLVRVFAPRQDQSALDGGDILVEPVQLGRNTMSPRTKRAEQVEQFGRITHMPRSAACQASCRPAYSLAVPVSPTPTSGTAPRPMRAQVAGQEPHRYRPFCLNRTASRRVLAPETG